MASKLVQFPSSSAESTSYLSELKSELKKVQWTSRLELLRSAKIVLCSILFFGLGIYLIDLSLRFFLSSLIQSVKWIVF